MSRKNSKLPKIYKDPRTEEELDKAYKSEALTFKRQDAVSTTTKEMIDCNRIPHEVGGTKQIYGFRFSVI